MSFIITLSTFSHYAPSHNFFFFFFNDTATTEIYTLSLHDALPISQVAVQRDVGVAQRGMVCKLLRKPLRVFLAAPYPATARSFRILRLGAFYNRGSMLCSSQLVPLMQGWARELGFSQIGVAGVDLSSAEPGLMQWLAQGFHGEMDYMQAHGLRRARPAELVPGTVSVITARMDYLPRDTPADAP